MVTHENLDLAFLVRIQAGQYVSTGEILKRSGGLAEWVGDKDGSGDMKELHAIILAAGKGTRMKDDVPKVLQPICGVPMVMHVVDALEKAGSLKMYAVIGHGGDAVREAFGSRVQTVEQTELLGTADAVRRAEGHFKEFNGDVLVVCGDAPLIRPETLSTLVDRHRRSGAGCTVLTAVIADPKGYGRIVRGADGRAVAIREDKDLSGDERSIMEINAGIYCFKSRSVFAALSEVRQNPRKKEFYLTDVVEIMVGKGWKIETLETDAPEEAWGVNTKIDLAQAAAVMRRRVLEALMLEGITIVDPMTTYIDAGVKIGRNTVIKPCTVIEGGVTIGKGCVVGPFAHLRPGTVIGDRTEIGNFAEVSRSTIGNGCFMKHFSFVGDATVGNQVNIGAGVVTANFDGAQKHPTTVETGAFVGSDAILVAPVHVGKNAVVGAGCVVAKEKNVPNGSVMVGVPGRVIGKKKKS